VSEHDAIKTMRSLPARLLYNIEFGAGRINTVCEAFGGEDADEWFWSCMDAIKRAIEEWHIEKKPNYIGIIVRREPEDKGASPWLTVHMFELTPQMPWIDLDEFEQSRERIFMIGQALGLAWRNRDAAAIVEQFQPRKS
jgi:hypothetical protein